jgi:hypothetical protein
MKISMLLPLAQTFLPVVVAAATGWLAHLIRTPKDHERAVILSQMAKGAVGLVLVNNKSNDWVQLLKQAVDQIVLSDSPPTMNRDVVTKAVASELILHGVKPPGRS